MNSYRNTYHALKNTDDNHLMYILYSNEFSKVAKKAANYILNNRK